MKIPFVPTQNITWRQIMEARWYWRYLSKQDLLSFWQHYTTGSGKGIYNYVSPTDTFWEYLVHSANESAMEERLDI